MVTLNATNLTVAYMVLRNFIHTLRSHKTASFFNIIGLAIAFTAFYIMACQIWYSVTFNRSLKDSDRVYMVSPDWNTGMEGGPEWSENCPIPATADAVAAFPDAESYTHMTGWAGPTYAWLQDKSGEYTKYPKGCYIMGASGIDIFGFKQVEGDLSRMAEPNTVIISRSLAEEMNRKPGDPIWFDGGKYLNDISSKTMMTVVGIYEDFPRNTFLYDHHIFRDDNCVHGQENNNWNYSAFVKLKKDADPSEYAEIWEGIYAGWFFEALKEWGDEYEEGDEKQPIKMIRLDKMYFDKELNFDMYETGSKKTTLTLTSIVLAILLVAFINFFNFYMALVPARIRSVNINKVLGASQKELRRRIIYEALCLVAVAFALALALILVLKDSFLKEYVTCSLAISGNHAVLMIIAALLTLFAVISAVYPAIHTTSVNISAGVKTGYAHTGAGRTLRSALIGIQFTVSMVLAIITSVFFMQYRYMIKYDLGFNRENILTFESLQLRGKGEAVIDRIKQHPDVMDVTASSGHILLSGHSIWGKENNGKQFLIHAYSVRWNFLDVMGIPVLDGSGFTTGNLERNEIVFCKKSLADVEGMYPDGKFAGYEVKGTIPDINLISVGSNDGNICLYTSPMQGNTAFYIRTRPEADIVSVKKHIKELVAEIVPLADEPEINYLDKDVEKMYADTLKQTAIIGIFALIAIVISLMGVFSIVMFETRHKESEISIRKVYGASVEEVMWMFNRRYMFIVAICFCIAVPPAWMISSRWLEQFANRIPIPLWIFPAVLAIIIAITMTVVTLRSLRAARTNPAEALKKE